jgi:putative ABC transport system permease protein
MTLALAIRNLERNRRRSLTTLAAIVIGTVAVLLFGGYTRNIRYGLQTGFVRSSGHLQIQHKGYFLYGSGSPATYGIADYQHVMDVVSHDPVLTKMLTVVTPTLQLGGIAGNFEAGVSRTVFATGTDVDGQNELRKWNDYELTNLIQPLALTGTALNSVVVGEGVARVLQLCTAMHVSSCAMSAPVGTEALTSPLPQDLASLSAAEVAASPKAQNTRIELLAATARGAPNVATLSVVKVERQGVKELDDVYVALHLPQAQRLIFGRDPPEVTAIAVQLQHTSQIPAARARIEYLLATALKGQSLEVYDYETLNPSYGQTVGLFATIFGFISVLIGVIVLFTVSNTMSMAVVERTPEIGTLRAIGLRRSGIRGIFMVEGMLLGLTGSILGIVIAIGLAFAINHGGITWTPPGRVDPVALTVRVWGEPAPMVGVVIALTLVTLVSSWIPSRRGASINIVTALRHA